MNSGLLSSCSPESTSQPITTFQPTPTSTAPLPWENPNPVPQNIHDHMDLGPVDAEYDLRFIDAMMPHHQGAVTMAQDAKQKSKRAEIKKLADEIIQAQTKEINQLQKWRQTWYPQAKEPIAYHAAMNHSMPMTADQIKAMRMDDDLGKADSEYDLRFIQAMIPHHQGAIAMAKDAANKAKRPEIRKLAQAILTSQAEEIQQMRSWRKSWYGK